MEDELKPGQQALVDEANALKPVEDQPDGTDGTTETPTPEPAQDEAPEPIPYQGKFKQFKTVAELEESYTASFKEAQRLHAEIAEKERELEALRDKPDDEADAPTDPAKERLDRLERELREKEEAEWKRDYDGWMGEHPDLADNAPLLADLEAEMEYVVFQSKKKNERLTMRTLLDRSWERIKPKYDDEAEAEGARKMALKQEAGSSAATGTTPKATTPTVQLTESEKRTARAYGLTDEQYLNSKLNK